MQSATCRTVIRASERWVDVRHLRLPRSAVDAKVRVSCDGDRYQTGRKSEMHDEWRRLGCVRRKSAGEQKPPRRRVEWLQLIELVHVVQGFHLRLDAALICMHAPSLSMQAESHLAG